MSNLTTDAGIPLLTEVIPAPYPAAGASETGSAASLPLAEAIADIAAPEATPPVLLDEEQLQKLESEIRERVLYQVLERIDFVLEQRVRDSLADVLQTAVEDLASEIRDGLHNSMRDVITRAVTHEITKLQTAKK